VGGLWLSKKSLACHALQFLYLCFIHRYAFFQVEISGKGEVKGLIAVLI